MKQINISDLHKTTKTLLEKNNIFFLRKGYEKKKYIKKLEKIKKYCLAENNRFLLTNNTTPSILEIESDIKMAKQVKLYQKNKKLTTLLNIVNMRNAKAVSLGFKNFYDLWKNVLKCQLDFDKFNSALTYLKKFCVRESQKLYKKNFNTNYKISLQEIYDITKKINDTLYNELQEAQNNERILNISLTNYVGGYCIYLPISEQFYIINNSFDDFEKTTNLIHELGHILQTKKSIKQNFLNYLFNRDVFKEKYPFICEALFLKETKKLNTKKWNNFYDFNYKENLINLIYLSMLYDFEKDLYNSKTLNVEKIEKLWESKIRYFLPHQIGNKEFTIDRYFNITDDAFESFSYLLGRIFMYSLLQVEKDSFLLFKEHIL